MGKNQQSKRQETKPENEGLPASPEIERAVLGLIFLNEIAYHELVGAGLSVNCFAVEANRKIFRVIQDLAQAQRQPDLLTVVDELTKRNELGSIGGAGYISDLLVGVPDTVGTPNLREYVEILNEKHMRRQSIHMANQIAACAMDPSDSIRYTVSRATEDLLRLQGDTTKNPAELVRESTQAVLDNVSDLMYVERQVIGIPFGVQELDELTTGIRPGELTICGGYPGAAKTAFALNVCRMAAKSGKPAVIFSLEMTKRELILRLFAQESGISYAKLRDPRNLPSSERRELDAWKESLDALPLWIDDQARNIEEIIPRAHLYIRQHHIELIAIDYLQLIQAPGESEYEIVSASSDALWWLEKSTQVPILCLSQLSRPEGRNRGSTQPPTLHMLRSSGKIEQNAHNVLLLHRTFDDGGAPTGEDLIIIAKQRAGTIGRVRAWFNGPQQVWTERTAAPAPPVQAQLLSEGVTQ